VIEGYAVSKERASMPVEKGGGLVLTGYAFLADLQPTSLDFDSDWLIFSGFQPGTTV